MKRFLSRLFVTMMLILPASLDAGARPLRLFEIFAVRITQDDGGIQTIERGLLDSFGSFRVVELGMFPAGVVAPPEALNRTLITAPTWIAYDMLGAETFANFEITGGIILIGDQGYFPVSASAQAKYDLGEVVNLSTRTHVSPGGDPVIGGFIVSDKPCRVLIRGVGPGLARFGVADPLADPYITVFKNGSNQAFAFNDNWEERYDAPEIVEVSRTIGAFALAPGSKDSAYLLELTPGTYTVHLTTYAGTAGTALLEIYLIP